MVQEFLFQRKELFGVIPLGRWRMVEPDDPIPATGKGYFSVQRRVQIERTPGKPHSLQITDTSGRLLRRSLVGPSLYHAGLTADGPFPGIRLRLETFPLEESSQRGEQPVSTPLRSSSAA